MGDSNNPYTTLSDATQPQSQNRTLRNGSASDRKGPTPRKDEHTGNNAVTNAIPRIVYRNCVNQEPFPFKVVYSHKQISLVRSTRSHSRDGSLALPPQCRPAIDPAAVFENSERSWFVESASSAEFLPSSAEFCRVLPETRQLPPSSTRHPASTQHH